MVFLGAILSFGAAAVLITRFGVMGAAAALVIRSVIELFIRVPPLISALRPGSTPAAHELSAGQHATSSDTAS
jgi:hypothetical protein